MLKRTGDHNKQGTRMKRAIFAITRRQTPTESGGRWLLFHPDLRRFRARLSVLRVSLTLHA